MAKLVRDRIPELIPKDMQTHIADDEEYRAMLREKLIEETQEFLDSETDENLVDILEVVYAICDAKGVRREALEELRKVKAQQRGAFTKRIVLD